MNKQQKRARLKRLHQARKEKKKLDRLEQLLSSAPNLRRCLSRDPSSNLLCVLSELHNGECVTAMGNHFSTNTIRIPGF